MVQQMAVSVDWYFLLCPHRYSSLPTLAERIPPMTSMLQLQNCRLMKRSDVYCRSTPRRSTRSPYPTQPASRIRFGQTGKQSTQCRRWKISKLLLGFPRLNSLSLHLPVAPRSASMPSHARKDCMMSRAASSPIDFEFATKLTEPYRRS